MKAPTKKDKLEYAVYSAIQFLNGSSKMSTDEIYSLLLEANDFADKKPTVKTAINNALRSTGKYKSIKVWEVSKSQTLHDEITGTQTLQIEVTVKRVKKKRKIIQN
jgi:hypothetical protein